MKKLKRTVFFTGLSVLLLTLLFSCSWTEGDGDGAQIMLNIAHYAARAIGVTEYEVTGLVIEVIDPAGAPLEVFEWDPGDGATQYLIPVEQAGQHRVVVTHIGDGGAFEATESSFFDIEPMIITVITIVPGMIGVIEVEGEGGGEEPLCDIVGIWEGVIQMPSGEDVFTDLYLVLELNEDGSNAVAMYDFEGGPLSAMGATRGTYVCDGGLLTITTTHMLSPTGEWVPIDPPMVNGVVPISIVGDTLSMDIDWDLNGTIDTVWILTRQ